MIYYLNYNSYNMNLLALGNAIRDEVEQVERKGLKCYGDLVGITEERK